MLLSIEVTEKDVTFLIQVHGLLCLNTMHWSSELRHYFLLKPHFQLKRYVQISFGSKLI